MDAAAIWSIIVFAIKLLLVAANALMLAVSLWLTASALREGVLPQFKPGGPTYTRAQNPVRFWLTIAWRILFAAALVVMIHAFIQLGSR